MNSATLWVTFVLKKCRETENLRITDAVWLHDLNFFFPKCWNMKKKFVLLLGNELFFMPFCLFWRNNMKSWIMPTVYLFLLSNVIELHCHWPNLLFLSYVDTWASRGYLGQNCSPPSLIFRNSRLFVPLSYL